MKHAILSNCKTFVSSNRYSVLADLKGTSVRCNKSSKPTEQETFKRSSNSSSRASTHTSNKITAENQLAGSIKQPTIHNLQDPKKNEKSQGVDEDNFIYPIPTIINGQLARDEKGKSSIPGKGLQDVDKIKSVNVFRNKFI
jgi:hypothetical protein